MGNQYSQPLNIYKMKIELIAEIKKIYQNGEIPISRNFKAKSKLINNHFGCFENLLIESGISIDQTYLERYFGRVEYSEDRLKEILYAYIYKFIKDNNKMPTSKDIMNNVAAVGTIKKKLKMDISQILENILKDDNELSKYILENKKLFMKNNLQELSKIIKRTPTSRDMDEYSKKGICNSASSYSDIFGSILAAQIECGFDDMDLNKFLSDDELIKFVQGMAKENDVPLTLNDLKKIPKAPSPSLIHSRFGGWGNLLRIAGLETRKIYITPDGAKCKSWYEYRFALMCETYGIIFNQEYRYDFISDAIKRKFRFDFILVTDLENGNYCFVELFFITNNKSYSSRKQEKIKICADNNIPLIFLDEHDINKFYDLDILHKLIVDKIDAIKIELQNSQYNTKLNKWIKEEISKYSKILTHQEIISLLENIDGEAGSQLRSKAQNIISQPTE